MTRLEVITGPMFSGKSEELIRRLRRFQYSGKKILVIKPKTDTRQENEIAAKILNPQTGVFEKADSFPAINVDNPDEVHPYLQNGDYDVVAIDEAQFINAWLIDVLAWHLVWSVKQKKDTQIFISGLDMDAWRKPFGIMPQLMAMADNVYKVKAVCFSCGEEAMFTQKIGGSKQKIEIGSDKIYEARCRKCHTLPPA